MLPMNLPKVFVFAVVSSAFAAAASAALPTFSQQTIELPPLALAASAKASLHPFERSEPVAPAPTVIIPERRLASADKFAFSPGTGVDYKLLIKHPDPSVDYKLIVKESAAPVRK